jgi:hypothetical protein
MARMTAAAAALLLAPAAAGAPRFVLPSATEHTRTPWDAESNPPLTPELAARGAVPWTWEPLPDTSAVCLDGSQYGLVVCGGAGPYTTVTINLQGGGVSAARGVWGGGVCCSRTRPRRRHREGCAGPHAARRLTCCPPAPACPSTRPADAQHTVVLQRDR